MSRLEKTAEELARHISEKVLKHAVSIVEITENGKRNRAVLFKHRGKGYETTIPLEPYLDMIVDGVSFDTVADVAVSEMKKKDRAVVEEVLMTLAHTFDDFELAKKHLALDLVNTREVERTPDTPFIPYLDMCIVFRLVTVHDGELKSIALPSILVKAWGKSVNELYYAALENMQNQFPAKIMCLNDFKEEVLLNLTDRIPQLPVYGLTNSAEFHGLACILYDGVLKQIAEKIGDFYIWAASQNEATLYPKSMVQDAKEVHFFGVTNEALIKEKNPSTLPCITTSVYQYERKNNKVTLVLNGS